MTIDGAFFSFLTDILYDPHYKFPVFLNFQAAVHKFDYIKFKDAIRFATLESKGKTRGECGALKSKIINQAT